MVKIMIHAPTPEETGWSFKTKEEAEQFMRKHKMMKVSDDEWVTPITSRGASKGPTFFYIASVKEDNDETPE